MNTPNGIMRGMSIRPRVTRSALCGVGALVCLVGADRVDAQQTRQSTLRSFGWGTGIELNATGGLLREYVVPAETPQNSPYLHSARVTIPVAWKWKQLEARTAVSIVRASAIQQRSTYALGALHVGTQRGKMFATVGVEHNIGVTAVTDPGVTGIGGDTLARTPGDTMKRSSGGADLMRTLDVVGSLGWNFGPSLLRLVAGVPGGINRSSPWLGIEGSMALKGATSFIVSTRYQSSRATLRVPMLTMGLSTSLWRSGSGAPLDRPVASRNPVNSTIHAAPTIETNATGDSVTLTVYLPDAQHAVVAGDATGWRPVDMTAQSNGRWSVTMALSSRISRMHLRTDGGAWRPIPGLPGTRDEYGGRVSLLVVDDNAETSDKPLSEEKPAGVSTTPEQ